jgi:hypothetical protein
MGVQGSVQGSVFSVQEREGKGKISDDRFQISDGAVFVLVLVLVLVPVLVLACPPSCPAFFPAQIRATKHRHTQQQKGYQKTEIHYANPGNDRTGDPVQGIRFNSILACSTQNAPASV